MKKFKKYLQEISDPVQFIQRAAQRFGTAQEYGEYWPPAPIGQHVPLPGFDDTVATEVHKRLDDVRTKLGGGNFSLGIKVAKDKFEKMKSFDINKLIPTQPFNYTGDEDLLKVKMAQTAPHNIFVVTHNGENYVIDGHHSIMGARLRGDRTVNARHINLDEY